MGDNDLALLFIAEPSKQTAYIQRLTSNSLRTDLERGSETLPLPPHPDYCSALLIAVSMAFKPSAADLSPIITIWNSDCITCRNLSQAGIARSTVSLTDAISACFCAKSISAWRLA